MNQKRHNAIAALVMMILLASCSKSEAFGTRLPGNSDNGSNEGSQTTTPPPSSSTKYAALAWESASKPERKQWSNYVHQIVNEEYQLLNRASDMTFFCPRYNSLSKEQRVNAIGQLIAAIAYYESGWSPVSRMQETTMGTDPVTGKPVYSEGLLQLSYQDIQWAPFCEFSWSKDRSLAATDPRKSILDPYKNLKCGIKILANQVDRKGSYILKTGVYWAVLKSGGKYEKIDEIATIVKKLSFCK